MTELFGIPAATLLERGGWGVVAVVVLMIITGTLVPGRTHTRELAREIKRGDDLKDALDKSTAAHEIESQQLAEILSFVRTAVRRGGD